MMSRLPRVLIAATLLLAVPSIAFAHSGAGTIHGFSDGFIHPFFGPDHIAAMVLVGALGWQAGGAARWLLPVTFMVCMAAGGAIGLAGIDLPMVEAGIAASIIVLGLMVGLSLSSPMALVVPLVAVSAVFHGYAHGLEMPETASGFNYALGFLPATASLHLGGLATGLLLVRLGNRYGIAMLRVTGGGMALLGVGILSGAV